MVWSVTQKRFVDKREDNTEFEISGVAAMREQMEEAGQWQYGGRPEIVNFIFAFMVHHDKDDCPHKKIEFKKHSDFSFHEQNG